VTHEPTFGDILYHLIVPAASGRREAARELSKTESADPGLQRQFSMSAAPE
jgi:hypothetical protein